MFRRKNPEGEDGKLSLDNESDAVETNSTTPEPAAGAIMAEKTPPTSPSFRPEVPRRVVDIPTPTRRRTEPPLATDSEGKKLVVGRDINLSGEITSCDKLVVEGRVEAALTESREIEIGQTGTFKGSAKVEAAVINGLFDGELVVHDRLRIGATGKVIGKVFYGRLEVECGGEIGGEIQVVSKPAAAAVTPFTSEPPAPPEEEPAPKSGTDDQG